MYDFQFILTVEDEDIDIDIYYLVYVLLSLSVYDTFNALISKSDIFNVSLSLSIELLNCYSISYKSINPFPLALKLGVVYYFK